MDVHDAPERLDAPPDQPVGQELTRHDTWDPGARMGGRRLPPPPRRAGPGRLRPWFEEGIAEEFDASLADDRAAGPAADRIPDRAPGRSGGRGGRRPDRPAGPPGGPAHGAHRRLELALSGALLLASSSLINHHRDGTTGSEEYRRMSSVTEALNEAVA